MGIHDFGIDSRVERVVARYNVIMDNAFLRKVFSKIVLPMEHENGKEILISKSESYRLNGYLFNDLYQGILGLAIWLYLARTEILPELKYRLTDGSASPADRIREQMAIENLKSNLDILTDELNNLYIYTVETDKASHKKKPPVYQRMKELQKLGQYLTSNTRGLFR